MASTLNAHDAAAYERSMGRWSRRLAPGFIAFAGLDGVRSVLDVGCASRFQQHLQAAYEAGRPDGPRPFACTAHVCRGRVPAAPPCRP